MTNKKCEPLLLKKIVQLIILFFCNYYTFLNFFYRKIVVEQNQLSQFIFYDNKITSIYFNPLEKLLQLLIFM